MSFSDGDRWVRGGAAGGIRVEIYQTPSASGERAFSVGVLGVTKEEAELVREYALRVLPARREQAATRVKTEAQAGRSRPADLRPLSGFIPQAIQPPEPVKPDIGDRFSGLDFDPVTKP